MKEEIEILNFDNVISKKNYAYWIYIILLLVLGVTAYQYYNLIKEQTKIKTMIATESKNVIDEKAILNELADHLKILNLEKKEYVEEYKKWESWNQEIIQYLK